MAKVTHRDKLLSHGLDVVLSRGYCGASVRDIVKAAGVPQGSFTNHFESKESFALEVLEGYHRMVLDNMAVTLADVSRRPLDRLKAWIDVQTDVLQARHMETGCLIGNFGIEASAHSERIRRRLEQIFREIIRAVAACLTDAVAAGELRATTDCAETAQFLYASLHGAIIQAKVERGVTPLQRFERFVFDSVLAKP